MNEWMNEWRRAMIWSIFPSLFLFSFKQKMSEDKIAQVIALQHEFEREDNIYSMNKSSNDLFCLIFEVMQIITVSQLLQNKS